VYFQVNSANVISETIDGETIIIDLTTGTYFSLRGTGAEIWDLIETGTADTQIVERLVGSYEGEPGEIAAAVQHLLGELECDRLIARVEGPQASPAVVNGRAEGTRRRFAAPSLEKHTDMQDLVLLDPVHQVDATGWPHAKPEAGTPHA
jgi:Coenzyme PQQ synthesis protein D (PqqD)